MTHRSTPSPGSSVLTHRCNLFRELSDLRQQRFVTSQIAVAGTAAGIPLLARALSAMVSVGVVPLHPNARACSAPFPEVHAKLPPSHSRAAIAHDTSRGRRSQGSPGAWVGSRTFHAHPDARNADRRRVPRKKSENESCGEVDFRLVDVDDERC